MDNRELAIKIYQQLNRDGMKTCNRSINVIMDVLDKYEVKAHAAAQQPHAGDGAMPSGAEEQTLSGDSSGEAGNTNPPRA